MKKIVALAIAFVMVMALSVSVFAAEIALTEENLGFKDGDAAVADGTITSSGTSFTVLLPEKVPSGEKVTVHIKGSSAGDFRVWLACGQATFSAEPLWKASEQGVTVGGDFDVTFELEAFPKDGTGDAADCIMFKAPSYDSTLDNFVLTYLSINGDGAAEAPAAEAEAEAPAAEAEAEAPAAEAEAPAAEAEAPAAETEAPAASTETKAPATGLALAVVPAIVAMAAVAVSKKH